MFQGDPKESSKGLQPWLQRPSYLQGCFVVPLDLSGLLPLPSVHWGQGKAAQDSFITFASDSPAPSLN